MDTPRNPILEVSEDESEFRRRALPSIMTSLPRERPSTATTDDSEPSSPSRRQRRRIREPFADTEFDGTRRADSTSSSSVPVNSPVGRPLSSRSSASPGRSIGLSRSPFGSDPSVRQLPDISPRNPLSSSGTRPNPLSSNDTEDVSDEEEIPSALGQLSLNEDEQVRYHGKASGLYILDTNERVDGRNAGGIWYASFFPPLVFVFYSPF